MSSQDQRHLTPPSSCSPTLRKPAPSAPSDLRFYGGTARYQWLTAMRRLKQACLIAFVGLFLFAVPVQAGFSSQPVAINIFPTTVTIRSVLDAADNVRCVLLTNGAAAPTAAEVNAGTGSSGATAEAAPPAVGGTNGGNTDVEVSGLSAGVAYDV